MLMLFIFITCLNLHKKFAVIADFSRLIFILAWLIMPVNEHRHRFFTI